MIQMSEEKRDFLLMCEKLLLVAINTLIFSIIWYQSYAKDLFIPFYLRGNIAIFAVFAFVYIVFARLYNGFDVKTSRALSLVYSHVTASMMTGVTMYFILWLLIRYTPRIIPMIIAITLWSLAAIAWSKPAVLYARKLFPPTKTVIIYDNIEAYQNGLKITKSIDWRFDVIGEKSVLVGNEEIFQYLKDKEAEAVMVCGIHSSQRNDILKYCIREGIAVYIRPNIGDYLVNSSQSIQMDHLPVLLCQRSANNTIYLLVKRIFDILFSLSLLILLSPILIITAIVIKLSDGGPALYKQERLTKDSKVFTIYKFRSMRVDAEGDGKARLAQKEDERITPVGKFIRMTRIDELPQLFNILKGEMSVVGPRPERPELTKAYEETMPEFSLRLQVKAGLTGYAQVNGKYNTSPYDKLQMDLMYISKMSVAYDLRIILETIKVIFTPESKSSTEGVAGEGITAKKNDNRDISESSD